LKIQPKVTNVGKPSVLFSNNCKRIAKGACNIVPSKLIRCTGLSKKFDCKKAVSVIRLFLIMGNLKDGWLLNYMIEVRFMAQESTLR